MIVLVILKCLKNLEYMLYIKDVYIIKLKFFIYFKNLDICCYILIKIKFDVFVFIYY